MALCRESKGGALLPYFSVYQKSTVGPQICLPPALPPPAQAKLQGLVRSKSSLDLPTGKEVQQQGQQAQGLRIMPLPAASGLSSGQVAVNERRSSGSSSSPLGSGPSAPRHPPRMASSEQAGVGVMAAKAASPHGVRTGRQGDRAAAAAEPMLTLSDMAQIYGGGDSEAEPGDSGSQRGQQQPAGLLGNDAEEEGDGPGIDSDLLHALKAAGPGFLGAAAAGSAINPALLEAFGSVIGSGSHEKPGGITSSGGCGQQAGGQQQRRASSRLSLQEPAAPSPMKPSPHGGGAQRSLPLAAAAAAPLSLLSPGRSQPRPHTRTPPHTQQRGLHDGFLPASASSAGRNSGGHRQEQLNCCRPEQLLRLLSEPSDLVRSNCCPASAVVDVLFTENDRFMSYAASHFASAAISSVLPYCPCTFSHPDLCLCVILRSSLVRSPALMSGSLTRLHCIVPAGAGRCPASLSSCWTGWGWCANSSSMRRGWPGQNCLGGEG